MRRGVPPSGLMTNISALPFGRESKAIQEPSGDHRGEPESLSNLVN
jgi:hypothetical protein